MLFRNQLVIIIGLLIFLTSTSPTQAKMQDSETTPPHSLTTHLYFIENQGQLDPQVSYYIQGQDKTLYFTSTGVTIALTKATDMAERWVVKLDFVEGSAKPVGQNKMETIVSYFRGSPDQWQTGVPTYAELVYPDLWPGIDLIYTLDDNQLKYHFIIQPGTDPALIRLAYRGASSIHLTPTNQLEVSTPPSRFYDAAPHAYQVNNGHHVSIDVSYHLAAPTADNTYEYGFQLGTYDPTRPLVLDPAIILYAGFIGGSQREDGQDIAVDANGCAYVTGRTHSTSDFPMTVGPDLSHNGGPYNGDAFIAKVKADGTGLVYAGFIGGSGEDYGYGVAVDPSGQAYVTGQTYSDDFPADVTWGDTYLGNGDAFLVKVNASGTNLLYGRYIGDMVAPFEYNPTERGKAIFVDQSKNAYVLVNTSSGQIGGHDASVFKVDPLGELEYVQFIGGIGNDEGNDLAVDADGYAYVTGQTYSSDLSTTPGAFDTTYHGSGDAFVAKIDNDGVGLLYATYIGNAVNPDSTDSGTGIAVDNVGNAYVLINLGIATFDSVDTAVVKLNAAGSALIYVKFIAGSDYDYGTGLALDNEGQAYITGNTTSAADFPITNWLPYSYDAPQEAFVAQVTADGTGLVYAGFLSGSGTGSEGIAVDSAGNVYVTGTNWHGGDFPATIGPDLTANGERDAFVIKVSPLLVPRAYLPLIMR